MDFPAKKKFIFDELRKRTRVAVETEGFQTDGKPADIFDAYDSSNSLSKLNSVEESVEKYGKNTPENFRDIRARIDDIKKALSDHANKLARNAEIGEVDLNYVDPKIFDKQAKLFEKINKDKLTIISPSFFI